MAAFSHVSDLLHETVDGLAIKPDGIYVDCTLGGAGHSSLVLSKLTTGKLIALDQDMDAIENARTKLAPFGDKVVLVHTNFERVGEVLEELAPDGIDGAMIDLGVSSHQLDTPERGFSYHYDAACTYDGYTGDYICSSCGEIMEEGNHVDLLKARGRYYNLYTLQNQKESLLRQSQKQAVS